jgi:hypothetical protein
LSGEPESFRSNSCGVSRYGAGVEDIVRTCKAFEYDGPVRLRESKLLASMVVVETRDRMFASNYSHQVRVHKRRHVNARTHSVPFTLPLNRHLYHRRSLVNVARL